MLQRKSKWLTPLILLLVLSIAIAGCGNDEGKTDGESDQTNDQSGDDMLTGLFDDVQGLKSDDPEKVVAEYEGGTMTQGEYDKYVNVLTFLSPEIIDVEKNEEFAQNIVNGYVTTEIMAERSPEKVEAKEEAQSFINNWKTQYEQLLGSPEKVNGYMEKLYITDEDIIQYYNRYKNMDAYLAANVSDNSVQQYYDEMKNDQFTTATVSHILVALEPKDQQNQPTGTVRTDEEALSRANEVIEKLNGGADFGELAKEYSDDWGSKENGGTYENTAVGNWVAGFKEAALTLEIGKLSEPVKTEFGYHVMKVASRTVIPFEEAKAQIEADPNFANFSKGKVYEDFAANELPGLIKKTELPAGETAKK